MTYTQLTHTARAAMFIDISNAAYSDDISLTVQQYKLENYTTANVNASYAHFASNSSEVVLAFRGTDFSNMLNIIQNVEFWHHKCGPGTVHAGILAHAASVFSQVLAYVQMHKGKKIWITGHSMGAASALYTAQQLELLGYSNMELYTYGCPRFGNLKYVRSIKTPHWRFVNCLDMIPTIPLVLMDYRHHGTLQYIDRHGCIRNYSALGKFCDQNIQRMQDVLGHGKIFDVWDYHDPDQYHVKLTALLHTD